MIKFTRFSLDDSAAFISGKGKGTRIMKGKGNPPVVITKDCNGCKQYVAICPGFVLEMAEEKAVVARKDWCIGCGHCGAVCPTDAILHEGTRLDKHPKRGEAPATSPEILKLLLRERRSVRIYNHDPVPEDILNEILDAGRYAPTGTNSQNVHYVVLTLPEQFESPSNFRANLHQGGTPLFFEIPYVALSLAQDTALRCKFNDVGLDLIQCRGKWYVIEANMEYGREGLRMKGMNLKEILREKLLSGELMSAPSGQGDGATAGRADWVV